MANVSNVNDFRSRIGQGRDIAKANRYLVAFNMPFEVKNAGTFGLDQTFLCETAELPGRALNTQDYRYYGPSFRMPHQSAYTDINFIIYVRSFMQDKKLFDNWIEYINPKTTYDFRFRNQYSTDINIFQYEDSREAATYMVTLRKAYPINVNPMPLSWSDDNLHKLQVTFCYVDWFKDDDSIPGGQRTLGTHFENLERRARQNNRQ